MRSLNPVRMPAGPKIVFLDAATLSDLPVFARFAEAGDFTSYPRSSPDQVAERAAGAQVIVVNKIEVDRELIEQLPELRLVCISATGTDNVDLAAAKERGIPVRNVAGYSTDSVAQLTFAALGALTMDLLHLNEEVYSGNYSKAKDFALWRRPYYEFGHQRFGIIGLGAIGGRVAELAAAYGAEVVYHSISGRDHDVPYRRLGLSELLESCDVISIHCALSEQTRNLIGAPELAAMKSSAYLINMARGGIVNEPALVEALDREAIAGAAMDVFTAEPLPADHPYLSVRNREKLLLTPHVAWASVEARTALVEGILRNIAEGY